MDNLYDRQKTLELKTPEIAVIGCGGIGYWVCKLGAMSGIERIYAFDPDTIEEHNLNRLDLPISFVGKNKADIVKQVIEVIRPECTVFSMPFKFSEVHDIKTDWLVDCTDVLKAQEKNQEIARKRGIKYCKAGYDGTSISIHNEVAEWGEAQDGYVVVPSWVVPAVAVAALTVGKIMKYESGELGTNLQRIYSF